MLLKAKLCGKFRQDNGSLNNLLLYYVVYTNPLFPFSITSRSAVLREELLTQRGLLSTSLELVTPPSFNLYKFIFIPFL